MSGPSPVAVRLVVQRQPVDEELFTELIEQECVELGSSAQLCWIDDLATALDGLDAAADSDRPVVLVPAPDAPDLVDLRLGGSKIVRVDLHLRDTDPSPGLHRHIQGRGIEGVLWALRTLHHGSRWPERLSAYGNDPAQYGALRLAAPGGSGERQPVVALLHGGFWRARWQLDLMDALAVDLAERGIASWNVEYRSPDRHGWDATVADVRAGVAHLNRLAAELPIDPGRLALVGHSAGGQLAVQLAADLNDEARSAALDAPVPVRPRLVVQLAGLVDLVETHRRDLGNGAVPTALGGTPQDLPAAYAAASPLSRAPIGVRQLVVVGRDDGADLREMSRRYVRAGRSAGDQVELLEDKGNHFTVIDPASPIWKQTADTIAVALAN
ncbi:alpha/beta hydrolase [Nakamurella lactea]|uniref:alpha/beta hydrolase n=1 Tax=Nakamurella lactea TaxID=459515 RepID=UPI000684F309|nr:alpha/beta hydrolase [Nakamurella lactea]